MSTPQGGSSRQAAYAIPGTFLILFALFYLHIRLLVNPKLLYYQHFPVFLTGFGFLEGFLRRPGGLAAYASAFLSQLYCYPWVGSAVITLIALLTCAATRGLLNIMAGARVHPAVYLFPAVVLLMLHNQYNVRLGTILALLTALAFANVYVRIALRSTLLRLAVFLLLSAVLYYVAGGMLVLYGVLCGIFELLVKGRMVSGVACLAAASPPPLIFALYSYEIDVSEAYVPLLVSEEGVLRSFSGLLTLPTMLHLVLLLFLVSSAVLTARHARVVAFRQRLVTLWRRLRRPGAADVLPRPRRPARPVTPTLRSLCLFLVAAAVLVLASFNRHVKTRLELGYFAQEKRWALVLERARRLPSALYDPLAMHDVNRALYHTGRLPDEMFTYPQTAESDSLFLSSLRSQAWRATYLKSSILFFEMGLVNVAQRSAHVALETYGELPEIVKLLVRINVLKKRPHTARTFLATLGRNPLCRKWAADYGQRLGEDPAMTSDEELQRVRPLMVTGDLGWAGVQMGARYEKMLNPLIEANPKNRMAFEYLMAHYLLTKQLDKVVSSIARLNDFDYSGIPRYYEEAIVLYEGAHPDRKIDLHGRRISGETRQRFRDYARYYVPYHVAGGTKKREAFEALRNRCGDSYFFYYTSNFSVVDTRPLQADVVTGASP